MLTVLLYVYLSGFLIGETTTLIVYANCDEGGHGPSCESLLQVGSALSAAWPVVAAEAVFGD